MANNINTTIATAPAVLQCNSDADNSDAALIGFCASYAEQNKALGVLMGEQDRTYGYRLPAKAEKAKAAILNRMERIKRKAERTRAKTPAGLRAKANLALLTLGDDEDAYPEPILLSILRDLSGEC